MMSEVSGKQIINNDQKEYAMYTLEYRAIPSCIDGLKPTERKLICAGLDHAKTKVKVAELGGMLSRYEYHHGEGSAQGTLVGMAQAWNNNVTLFEGYGNFGSRLIQEAAAPRYIFVKLSDNFKKYFRDFEVAPKHKIAENPEPQTYLPIIPWVLVNGVKGIAVGFATDILPRDAGDLMKATIACAKGKKFSAPSPKFPFFKGEVTKVTDSSWTTTGIVTGPKRSTYMIEELPWGYSRESYFNVLTRLEEDGKIDEFSDLCDESGFKFEVKVSASSKQKAEDDPIAFFKLQKTHSENITTLDENGKLKLFDSPEDVIKYFVDYRIKKTQDKIDYDIEKNNEVLSWYEAKYNFILAMLTDGIKGNTKQDLEEIANGINSQHTSRLIRIPAYEFADDEVKNLKSLIASTKKEITRLKKIDPTEEYIRILTEAN